MPAETPTPRPPASFRFGRGPRHTEAQLLAALDDLLPTASGDFDRLASPVVVVVPSNSLRDHLAARIVTHRGRAVAGLRLVTLYHLAGDILARNGGETRDSDALFDVLVWRRARAEAALRDRLDPLVDGYAAVHATVRDLLDAGLGEAHLDAVLEQVDELARRVGWRETAALAAALVRIAADVARTATELGVACPGERWAAAEEALARDPEGVLPARAVLVHGYADATGTAADLIRALVAHRGATVFLDDPPDPADANATDHGVEFSRRFRERLGAPTGPTPGPDRGAPAQVELQRAPGAHAEARAVAARVRALLDAGIAPESILVVARDLAPYALPLRTHFARLAVPFSAPGATLPSGAPARRVAAFVDLVENGLRAGTDRWLEAAGGDTDLRVALRSLALVTLRSVAGLAVAEVVPGESLPLPVRRGFETEAGAPDDGGDEDAAPAAARALRRHLPRAALERAVARARRTAELFAAWPVEATVAAHLERARALVTGALSWSGAGAEGAAALAAIAGLAAELPTALAITREELALLLRRRLAEAGHQPLGGQGGGVQVLSVVEARARTAEHLFLLGLNRDLFPRPAREDPLLPDAFRGALRVTLEALPLKLAAHAEERYLFAQLLAAAPHVTLSWQALDDDGRERAVSPLVQRLLQARGLTLDAVPACPSALGAATTDKGPRPALEHALAAGLAGGRDGFRAAFAAAARATSLPEAAATHRLAVLDEFDPPPGARPAGLLGPFFGLVGARRTGGDPRAAAPAVTTLEGVARCPWQAFLRTVLRLEPPRDPLERIAGLDPLLVGAALHDALEALVARAGVEPGGTLDDALGRAAVAVPWPPPGELQGLVADCARRVARDAGAPALAAALAARVRPFLELARELDWSSAAPQVLGAEVAGEVTVADASGTPRTLTFRADRVDRSGGEAALTDYKTGTFVSDARRAETRRRKLVEQVAAGERLQAVAYALAAAGRGRYLFLRRPEEAFDREVREVEVAAGDAEVGAAFTAAVAGLLDLWDAGGFVPRLLDPALRKTADPCKTCDLRAACLQGDSLSRRRLAVWLQAPGGTHRCAGEAAARAVLRPGPGEAT